MSKIIGGYHLGPVHQDLGKYIEEKIRMLAEDFMVSLSEEEIERFEKCKSECECDNIAHSIIFAHLNGDRKKEKKKKGAK